MAYYEPAKRNKYGESGTVGRSVSASAQYDNTQGAWLTQEGCTIMERKEGRVLLENKSHYGRRHQYCERFLNYNRLV